MQGVKVIVVEDHPTFLDMMKIWMETVTNCEVIACGSVEEIRRRAGEIAPEDKIVLVTDGRLVGTQTCLHVIACVLVLFRGRVYNEALLVSGDHRNDWEALIGAAKVLGLNIEYRQKGIDRGSLQAWWDSIKLTTLI